MAVQQKILFYQAGNSSLDCNGSSQSVTVYYDDTLVGSNATLEELADNSIHIFSDLALNQPASPGWYAEDEWPNTFDVIAYKLVLSGLTTTWFTIPPQNEPLFSVCDAVFTNPNLYSINLYSVEGVFGTSDINAYLNNSLSTYWYENEGGELSFDEIVLQDIQLQKLVNPNNDPADPTNRTDIATGFYGTNLSFFIAYQEFDSGTGLELQWLDRDIDSDELQFDTVSNVINYFYINNEGIQNIFSINLYGYTYSDNFVFCNLEAGAMPNLELWYVSTTGPLEFSEIVSLQKYLFFTEAAALASYNTNNASINFDGLQPVNNYWVSDQLGSMYLILSNNWFSYSIDSSVVLSSPENMLPFQCTESGGGLEIVHSLTVLTKNASVSEFSNYCYTQKEEVTIYYKSQNEYTLQELASYGLKIYKTAAAAENDIEYLIYESTVFGVDSNGYFAFYNLDGSYYWQGLDNITSNEISYPELLSPLVCFIPEYPDFDPENYLLDTDFPIQDKEKRVFYAFKSCAPNESGQFPVYIIDSLHFNDGSSSYVTDFIDQIYNESEYVTFNSPSGSFEQISCKTLINKVLAVNLDDAQNILIDDGNPIAAIQYVAPETIGIFSEASIDVYLGCSNCIEDIEPEIYTFPFIADSDNIFVVEPRTDLERNYELDDKSRPLLRTNPKLTTNVKIVYNSEEEIYLESINASKELTDSKYKRYRVSSDGFYMYDLSRFWNNTNTPFELAFNTKREWSDLSVLDTYNKQFEEEYHYGTRLNYSKLHDERLRIFAPIWIDVNIPKKFLIYRVNDPVPAQNFSDSASDKHSRILSLLKNATLIKTVDLSENSILGKYIRNHSKDQSFPDAPISATFEKDEKTLFRGIDLIKGGFVDKGEYIYEDFVKVEKPLIEENDFITDGFKRNNLAIANILNLEFLFDDDTPDYSIDRYFGLYVDDIPSGTARVSSIENDTLRLYDLDSYMDHEDPSFMIPSYNMTHKNPVLGYVKSPTAYHNIKNGVFYNSFKNRIAINTNGANIDTFKGIRPSGRKIEILKTEDFGYDFISFEIKETPNNGDQIAIAPVLKQNYEFKLMEFPAGAMLKLESVFGDLLEWQAGLSLEEFKSNLETAYNTSDFKDVYSVEVDGNIINVIERDSHIKDTNMTLSSVSGPAVYVVRTEVYDNSDMSLYTLTAEDDGTIPAARFSGKEFSTLGKLSDVAISIVGAINANTKFLAKAIGTKVYVRHNSPGFDKRRSCLLVKKTNVSNFIEAENLDVDNRLDIADNILNNWTAYRLLGGFSAGHSVKVTKETSNQISTGDFLQTKKSNVFNMVLGVFEDFENVNGSYDRVVLAKKYDLKSGEIDVYHETRCEVGLFSAYDIYDLNFDFYDESNSALKELNYEKLKNNACNGDGYFTYGPGEIYCQSECGEYDLPTGIPDPSFYVNSNICLAPEDLYTGLLPVLESEDVDALQIEKLKTEYDRLQENNTKEFATNSRVVPNINKWVLKDVVNVRENPYYLNANSAFGRTNFAADITKEGRDPANFSHEWFYIDKLPSYFKYDMVNESFSYINFVDGFEIQKDQFKDINTDYFDIWFWNDGFEVNHSLDGINDFTVFSRKEGHKKYSRFNGGSTDSFASTIFRGLKFIPKKRKEYINEKAYEFIKDSEFNGYKFSTIVKVNTNAKNNLIDFEIIQNEKFKFIVFFIELSIDDENVDGWINRSLLYNMNSKLQPYNGGYIFSNVSISGAILLSNIDNNLPGPYEVEGFLHTNDTSPQFLNQIVPGFDGTFGKIKITYAGVGEFYIDIVNVIDNNTLLIAGLPYNDDGDVIQPVYLSLGAQASAIYEYVGGGLNGHTAILNSLTAKTVSDVLNSNGDNVKYTTVDLNGQELSNRFILNVEDGTEFVVKSNLTRTVDDDSPQSYKLFQGNIGYNITERQVYYPLIIRHNGKYTVDMRPVVTFTDMYSYHKVKRNNYTSNSSANSFKKDLYKVDTSSLRENEYALAWYKKYNRCGISFNIGFIKDTGFEHDLKWGMIKNHFYHKVNDINTNGVIKLTESGEYPPLYPLINEVAIDRTDVNVFRSSWESEYYTRSLAGGGIQKVPGTLSTAEEKSYLGSTQMKVLRSYQIYDFTQLKVNSDSELDTILRNGTNTSDIVWFENEQQIIADFYMVDAIARRLSQDGVLESISNFVTPDKSFGDKTALEDDALRYVYQNLIPLFSVDIINIYANITKQADSTFESGFTPENVTSGGYRADSNFTYKLHNNLPINFRLIYNKRIGYSHLIRPIVKIES